MCVKGKSVPTEHEQNGHHSEQIRVQPDYIGGHQLTASHGREGDAWWLHRGLRLL